MPGPAADRYRVEVVEPSRGSRLARLVGALNSEAFAERWIPG